MPFSSKKTYIGNKKEYVDKNGRVRIVRKKIPKFGKLFSTNTGQNKTQDSFDDFKLPVKRRKAQQVTDETFSLENESFDQLFKGSHNYIRKVKQNECSNSNLTSTDFDSTASSVHFLSPLAVSRPNKKPISVKFKDYSPDMFADSMHSKKRPSISAFKENITAANNKVDNGLTVQFAGEPNAAFRNNSLLTPFNMDHSTATSDQTDCIVTSTPAVPRISSKYYLTRLHHLSPFEKEHQPAIVAEHSSDNSDCIRDQITGGSSVYMSVRGSSAMPSRSDENNQISVRFLEKSLVPFVTRLPSRTLRTSMLHKVLSKESRSSKQLQNTGGHISNIGNKSIQNMLTNKDCSISINVNLSHAKDWKRTLKNTLNQMPEACILMKGEHDESELQLTHSRSLLESLPLSPDGSEIEKNEEEYFFQLCCQTEPIPMRKIFPKSILQLGKKVGEGIYGEVFAMKSSSKAEAFIVKLIPIEGSFNVNEEPQKTIKEVISELVVSRTVSMLREKSENECENFPFLCRAKCLTGKYPLELIKLWDKYDRQKGSENDRPNIFPKDQLYLMLELNHAGEDLETYEFNNAMQGYSIFLQVAYALGVAEEALEFEHRDLHWGNILIKATDETHMRYRLKGKEYQIESRRLKATVIDFTLSRLRTTDRVYFNDLSKDPTLFIAEGDPQFEIYRQMRTHNRNQWKDFNAKTNIFWLHYLVTKIIKECHYRNKLSKIHKKYMGFLRKIEKQILSLESASQFVINLESR